MKKIFLIIFLAILLVLSRNLNPLSSYFFTFHDETQPARIEQFVKELKSLHIPPRVASDMNFGVGYPVFNFYAPASYWITGSIHLLGFNIINSIKISFFLTLVIGFFGVLKLLNLFFSFLPSFIGATFYITSLYFPINIFVRGNLAESWALSLLPITLFFILRKNNNKKIDKKIFLTKIFLLSLFLTSHNILSIIFFFLIVVLIFITKDSIKINLISLILSVLLTSYFWLPLILEIRYTWAKKVAEQTKYYDHYLCPTQIWQSEWGYGGSAKGCQNDGMSFKIGKLQLIFFFLGILFFLKQFLSVEFSKIKDYQISLFFLFFSLFFLFLTTYHSYFFWKILEPYMKIIQFPWRFIGPSILGIVYFSAYFFDQLKIPFQNYLIYFFIFLVVIVNQKYFTGQKITNKEFNNRYLSKNYIKNKVAFKIAEYLPKTNDYYYWRSLEKKIATKQEIEKLSLVPFNKKKQTFSEKLGNYITLITLFAIFTVPVCWLRKYKIVSR